ncbi:MAG: alkaline phosphatase D family protein, partial [Planctomycetota bacterium]
MSNTNNHFRLSGRAMLLLVFCLSVVAACRAAEFESRWPKGVSRTWIGPQYWANRLQDWWIRDGRLECLEASANKPMRTVHLLTHRIAARKGDLTLTVRLGLIDPINKTEGAAVNAAAGFLIGAGGPTMDYRAAALVHHNPGPGGGLFVGVNPKGNVVIHDFEKPLPMPPSHEPGTLVAPNQRTPIARDLPDDVTLRVTLKSTSTVAEIWAEAFDTKTGKGLGHRTSWKGPFSARFVGNVALVSHPGGDQRSDRFWFRDWTGERKAFEKWSGATARFWFRDWKVSGSKVEADDGRKLGPVISTQYTLHRGTLKLTAQLFPVGPQDGRNVQLQARQGESWRIVAEAPVIMPGYTASFRVEDWDDTRDTPYRVRYEFQDGDGKPAVHHFAGKIRRDPMHKQTVVVAAFTGNMQVRGGYEYPLPYGIDAPFPPELSGKTVTESNTFDYTKRIYFPHTEVVRNVARQRPDLLFFSGDQVYEGNPTRAQEKPYEKACLDYLYKWYLWCWSFRDLTREIPTVTIPDDHDVYQRNIWGDGGKASPEGDLDGSYGGYFMPPEWINMIQRTQTSHLPDPFDPRPAQRGVEVYYTALTTGGIGFAIIEDRKFKSFPTVVKAKMSRDSHITEPAGYDTREADVPGATLLGERQLKFLHEFSKDWRGQ